MRKVLLVLTLTLGLLGAAESIESRSAHASPAIAEYSKADCEKIVKEIKRQHGGVQAQRYLGRFIAWRESGCSLQCVKDHDDLSCSRFGINFRGSLANFWGKLCNAWDRSATKSLYVDVKCALRAFIKYGTKPWRR